MKDNNNPKIYKKYKSSKPPENTNNNPSIVLNDAKAPVIWALPVDIPYTRSKAPEGWDYDPAHSSGAPPPIPWKKNYNEPPGWYKPLIPANLNPNSKGDHFDTIAHGGWDAGKSDSGWDTGKSGSGWDTGKSGSGWDTGKSSSGWDTGKSSSGWDTGKSGGGWDLDNSGDGWGTGWDSSGPGSRKPK